MKYPQVICDGCGCRRAEKNMEIYVATTDEYFCTQECLDESNRKEEEKEEIGLKGD